MAPPPFLDTNVLLRHLLGDHADHSPRATSCVQRIERGELRVRTSDTVVFETVFVLERRFHEPKAAIRDNLLQILNLPGIELPGKQRLERAFDLYVNRNIPFADAYHAALMESLGLVEIVSFDTDFDRIPGLRRVEP